MTKKIFSIIALLCMAVSGAWAYGIVCTAEDFGKVICTDGSIYATVTKAEAAGKTAAAMIAYLDTENKKGLAIALANKGGLMNWNTVNGASGVAAHTPAIEGQTWRLASEDEWKKMFKANGGNVNKYNGLNTAIFKAGGTSFTSGDIYWSSTESSSTEVKVLSLSGGNVSYYDLAKNRTFYVRACFDFDIVTPTANDNEWTFVMPAYNVKVNVEYYDELVDNVDNSTILASLDGKTTDIYVDRTLGTGKWYTLCLPFTVDLTADGPLKGVTAKTLSSVTNDGTTLTVTFGDDEMNMKAGTPYIVRLPEGATMDIVDPLFEGATISKTLTDVAVSGATFKGTYAPVVLQAGNKRALFLQNNTLYYPGTDATIKAFRAYIELDADVPTSAGAPNIVLNFGDTTGVNEVKGVNKVKDDSWYTLDGRRIVKGQQPTAKGVYIHNGRKEVVK